MSQDADAGRVLEPFRQYLRVLAHVHLDARPARQARSRPTWSSRPCCGPASVSTSCAAANPGVVAAWLRKVLARTLADAVRDLERAKRDVGRERSLEAAVDQSASGMEGWLAADQSSPSERADRNEQLLRLADALCGLPDDTREAVVLKHCRGWTLAEIAEHLGRTPAAVASLLHRGLKQLRELLHESD